MEDQFLLDNPVRFIPPHGSDAEWPDVVDLTDADWECWLLGHNAYPFLRQWTSEQVAQYLLIDRFKYGLGFRQKITAPYTWFYNPAPIAVPFHSSKIANILFGGAAGGSKSYSLRFDAYRHCFSIPEF